MTKKLFKDKSQEIKKKKQILISQGTHKKLDDLETRAEKQGVSFPLDEHIEDAIKKLIRLAESQLAEIEASRKQTLSLDRSERNPTA
ncbi:hypothetical protein MGA5115_01826 [Marinomonas gallaica]|uniref:Uncharacterized protein n=1 Tax=Marinomonas gallaica TaxID=1806667 RepID=A0A1C3JRM9_9GAMM|nr:hypothetical protein [Marinomonas gallaica]SBT17710.1 hypothetical protein MGA5115_01826 [Marinomonas gallaica]SBT20036.1 hypothetical protein MGA5116_00619 [Marinomonas gallaica]